MHGGELSCPTREKVWIVDDWHDDNYSLMDIDCFEQSPNQSDGPVRNRDRITTR